MQLLKRAYRDCMLYSLANGRLLYKTDGGRSDCEPADDCFGQAENQDRMYTGLVAGGSGATAACESSMEQQHERAVE